MDQIKTLAKEHLSSSQLRLLRRWLHAWREWRYRTAGLGYTVWELRHASRQLWMGHSATAAHVLQRIHAMTDAPRSHRAAAAFQLAKQRASKGEMDEVVDLLPAPVTRYLNKRDRARAHVIKAAATMQLGRTDAAQQALNDPALARIGKNQQWLLRANLEYYRAVAAGDAPNTEADRRRLAHVNRMYRDAGLSEIEKRDANRPLGLDNIVARDMGRRASPDGPLVSVLMPCFNAEATLRFALDSVLAQTHCNQEIICVDDQSTDGTRAIIQSYSDAGAPVTLLVNDRNAGPYHSRNRALEHAMGDYVTVQDADDWMHPQRIEVQLAHLRAKRNVRFSFTRLARVAEGFVFTLRPYRPMLEPIHWNYTSILGAREAFLELGGWDPVIAHADAELVDRIKDRFGQTALGECHVDVAMSLFTDGAGNLTKRAGTSLTSVGFGARREYQQQARDWRARGAPGLRSGGVMARPSGRDPFFAPNALLPLHLKRDSHYDFVFVTDMSLLGGTRRCNLEYFRVCAEQGWKVGVFNHPRYRAGLAGEIAPEYRKLFDCGEVDLLTPEDSVDAGAVVVHHPPLLDAPVDGYPRIRSANVALLVNQLPYQSTQPDAPLLYGPERVEANIARALGSRPFWIPISGLVREQLERLIPGDRIIKDTWYPVVDDRHLCAGSLERQADPAKGPIRLGRHSRDDATKWPGGATELRAVYPNAEDIQVYILGGADTVCAGKVRIPANWTVYAFDSMAVADFLARIDVFIHWTRSDYIEEFGRNVAEAMAFGVPCILSPDLEPTFGDAALYPAPADVEQTVRELAGDAALRRNLVAKGKTFVAENCSTRAAAARMARLLPPRARGRASTLAHPEEAARHSDEASAAR